MGQITHNQSGGDYHIAKQATYSDCDMVEPDARLVGAVPGPLLADW